MHTKNLAIMCTDIVGSSATEAALNRSDSERFRSQYEEILRPIITRRSGELFKAMGDGYLAAFESSTNAVLAALDIQAQLKSFFSTYQLDHRFATRIGVASGDVTVTESDRFGVPVIHATRVQSIADTSSTFITESVFLTMNRNEVYCEDLGYISLKGLEDKTRVFRVESKGEYSTGEEVAVLCTDLTQFTVSVDNRLDLDEVLAAYDEIVFREALSHNGFFRYNLGDMYLITFKSAADALDAAAAMLESWNERRDRRLHSFFQQFGLDYGPVRNIRGRLYGSTLSRIAPALAHASTTIAASDRFLRQLSLERPDVAPPTTMDKMIDLPLQDIGERIRYATLVSGRPEP